MHEKASMAGADPFLALRSAAAIVVLALGLANDAAAEVLEEIVVTAQRREQNLQDVGISVSALSGDAARTLGMQTTTDLTAHMPNVQMFDAVGGPGMNVSLAIRGGGCSEL